MDTTIYSELANALWPEVILTVGLLLALAYDLALGRHMSPCRRRVAAVLVGLASLAAATFQAVHTVVIPMGGEGFFYGSFVLDGLTLVIRVGVFGLSALSLLVFSGSARLRSPAEYVAIQLLATVGFSLMAAANNLLIAFLGLELASLSLYILAGFDKTSRASAEAGLKYFLFGGMAAAFVLFGFSLLYGLTGSIDLTGIAYSLSVQEISPLLLVALIMVLVGFGYKAAAAPFHLWAPDVYQGAPAPAAALIASASKLAGIALFARLLLVALGPVAGSGLPMQHGPGWLPVLMVVAAASMVVGNIAALAQDNVRRLFAYSAIAHAGVMLLGVITIMDAGLGPIYYYAVTYGIATIGVFGVFAVIEQSAPCQKITDLAGLWKRSPFLAGCLFIYVLSLAGVPPLAGFLGKFYVFAAALRFDGLGGPAGWLTLLAIALSAVGLYYYLVVLKQALIVAPAADRANQKIRIPFGAGLALFLCAALIVVLGIFPSIVLGIF